MTFWNRKPDEDYWKKKPETPEKKASIDAS